MHTCRFQSQHHPSGRTSLGRETGLRSRGYGIKGYLIAELVSRNMSQKQKPVFQELSWSTILAKRPISGAVNRWIESLQSRRVRYEWGRGYYKDLILECISIVAGCMKPARSIGVPSEAFGSKTGMQRSLGLRHIVHCNSETLFQLFLLALSI